jgi:hypothetical protein
VDQIGPDLSLKRQFGLVAIPGMTYADRTKRNVDDADGTIAFRLHPGNGTDKTIGWAHWREWTYGVDRAKSKDEGWRPVLVIHNIDDSKKADNIAEIQSFIVRNKIAILNVAGHRETTSGMGAEYGEKVRELLVEALKDVIVGVYNPATHASLPHTASEQTQNQQNQNEE